MEMRHLRYFIAVAQEENVSRAALALHVSQPGISRQIRDLEDEIGFLLFQRTPKSVKLTEAGKVFLKEAKALLQRAHEAVETARAVATGENPDLHVGYAPSLTARFLPRTLRAFQAAVPKVHVRLHDCSTEEMLVGLRRGKLQISFTVCTDRRIFREFEFVELTRDALCLAVSLHHPFASRRRVTLQDTAREPLITYTRKDYPDAYKLMTRLFAGVKTKPRIAEEHDSVNSLIAAVEAGAGVAIVGSSLECTSGARLKLIPFSPPLEPLIIGAVQPHKPLSFAAEQFLNCARKSISTSKGRLLG